MKMMSGKVAAVAALLLAQHVAWASCVLWCTWSCFIERGVCETASRYFCALAGSGSYMILTLCSLSLLHTGPAATARRARASTAGKLGPQFGV